MNIPPALRYATAALLIGVLIWLAGPAQVASAMLRANPWWLAFSLVALLLTFIPGVLGLRALAEPLKPGISTRSIIRAFGVSWAVGTILPGRVGTVSVIALLRAEGIGLGEATALFFLDKFITLTVFIAVSIAGLFLLFGSTQGIGGVIVAFILVCLAAIILYSPHGRGLIRRFVLRGSAHLFAGFFATTKKYLTTYLVSVIRNYIWTTVKVALDSLVIWSVFNALGMPAPYLAVAAIYAASAILSFVPITVAGIGFRESAAIVLYASLGIAASAVVAVHLLIYALTVFLAGAIIFFYLRVSKQPFSELVRFPR